MSVSACLLDKYGGGGHDFTESALTSIKTLNYINPSDGKLRAERSRRQVISSVFYLYTSSNKRHKAETLVKHLR